MIEDLRLAFANPQSLIPNPQSTMYDQATVQNIIEEITREVLLRLNQAQPATQGAHCNCKDGSCVQNCAEQVNQVVNAGASRLTATLGVKPQSNSVAGMIDHTLLKADASQDQIAQLCYEAKKHEFASVCVNPSQVKLAAQLLKGSKVKVCTVVGFPLGGNVR